MCTLVYRIVNTQESNYSTQIPLPKIHKFEWLVPEIYGNGQPIKNNTSNSSNDEIKLQYRFINPSKYSPSSNLAKFIGNLLQPMQNSGLRNESISGIVHQVQLSIDNSKISEDETFVSFDAVKLYDTISYDLLANCIKAGWKDFKDDFREVNQIGLLKCIKTCYEEPVYYKNEFYHQKSGSPTGHPISSMAQNIILTQIEKTVFKPMIESGKIKFYGRWVDDIIVRCNRSEVGSILDQLNEFDQKLKFTADIPKIENGIYKLPYLDFCVLWNNVQQITKVYRKPTSSKKVMPWAAFAPNQWKSGTLVNFVRRAYTHSSNLIEMHNEIANIKKIYRKMGYPKWFIDDKLKKL